jgi:hypothetical protein
MTTPHRPLRFLARAVLAAFVLSAATAQAADEPPAARTLADYWLQAKRAMLEGYMAVIDANLEDAAPLPQPVKDALLALVGKPGIPFEAVDVDAARWKKSDHPVARFLFPETYGQKGRGITHGSLILVNDDFLSGPPCAVNARWAHELAHIQQNRRDGRAEFLDRYLKESIEKGYADISYEREAYAVQRVAERAGGCGG